MNEKYFKKLKKQENKYRKDLQNFGKTINTKEKALSFLKDVGILNIDGTKNKNYEE